MSSDSRPRSFSERIGQMKLSDNAKEWIKDIGIALAITAVILIFVNPTIVREHSMESTLQDGDYLFVSRQAYRLFGGTPERGDIVVFSSELETVAGSSKLLIKRVIGTAGDRVAISGGVVYVNGSALIENYTKDGYTASDMEEITVPEGHLFCMGDNRQNSTDSRDSRVGFIALADVMGKAVFRLYPFSKFGSLMSK